METISDAMSRSLLTFLLNSLWQIPLAAAVAALACRFMRTGPASHRHAIWVAALAAAILLPLASVRTVGPTAAPPFAVSLPAPDAIPAKSGLAHGLAHGSGRGLVHGLVHELGLPTQLPPALSPAPASATVSFAKTWAAILLGAYALFVLVRLARLVRAAMRTVRIRRAAHEAAIPELLERVSSRCQAAFGLTGVKLLFSAQVSGPVTAGRAIILPESLRVEAPEDVVTTAIGHEMAHIARRDFASNLLYELLQLPVGFHPAAWLIRSGMERTREMACDEAVALRLIDAAVYARSIMSIAAGMTALPHPGYTLGVFDGDILEERIRRLVERPAPNLKHARLMLVAGLSALALCAVIASSLALTAAAQGVAGNLMKQAGDAYNRGDYEEAARQFEDAVRRDPANLKAKLFLADSLLCELQEYGPAADTRVIVAKAQQQYLDVMARDATNKHAMQGMMALYTRTMHFAQAHEWALKAIQADPANATAYYTAGFVDWVIAYPAYAGARQAAGMKPQDPGVIPDEGLRQSVRAQQIARIEEGLGMLQTALQIDPGFTDAMAYMSLLYRIEAAIADSGEQSLGLIAAARNWVMTARTTERMRAQNSRRPYLDDPAREPSPPSPPPPPPGNYYLGPR